ncbi:MAG: hypothetical protein IT301_13460 [Dehalococcoidia bacterium]|nr:hypothetical protein [Dehalococcoidia bacterium]
MIVRKGSRREVRLDPEYERKLEEQLQCRGLTFAAWVREQIDEGANTERSALEKRLRAARAIGSMNIDLGWDPDDPDPATRLLNEAFDARWRDADPLA